MKYFIYTENNYLKKCGFKECKMDFREDLTNIKHMDVYNDFTCTFARYKPNNKTDVKNQ